MYKIIFMMSCCEAFGFHSTSSPRISTFHIRKFNVRQHPSRSSKCAIRAAAPFGTSKNEFDEFDGENGHLGTDSPVTVQFRGGQIRCNQGELLRTALLRNKMTPHNGRARIINCRGLGTCGTCAVAIAGVVSPPQQNAVERGRLALPPFTNSAASQLRLACQVRIEQQPAEEPLRVTKFDGFWGQYVSKLSEDTDFELPFGQLEFLLDPSQLRKTDSSTE